METCRCRAAADLQRIRHRAREALRPFFPNGVPDACVAWVLRQGWVLAESDIARMRAELAKQAPQRDRQTMVVHPGIRG